MASPYQQQALRRKLIYLGLIVVLFTVSGIFRAYVVEARARELALLEQNVGDVEISGSALQLSLTGSRGFVICALWTWAIDAQKRNKWNELELYVDSLTRLQPHFISPWRFLGWNLAYNVSVEADQVKDKYFYISRGTQLMVKGERKNHNQPNLRDDIGFFQQHKIMQSDETNYHRCLYQLSCIPPPERDPARFWKKVEGRDELDLLVFEKFCIDHPQLVRRLHDKLRCDKPEKVVSFLKDNQNIPSLYVDDPNEARDDWAQGRAPLKRLVEERFPILPPPADSKTRREELAILGLDKSGELIRAEGYGPDLSNENVPDDGIDGYAVSRAWYGYAQEALPEPHPKVPGGSAPIVDRTRQRKSQMTVNLFRNHPPRAASYSAERLQEEGWFGPEGWKITGWFPGDKFHDGRDAVVGTDKNWGEDSWHQAYEFWERRGRRCLFLIDPQRMTELEELARAYLGPLNLTIGTQPPGPDLPEDDPMYKNREAAEFLFEWSYATRLANFWHFYHRALVEMEPQKPDRSDQSLLAARRTMFNARQSVRGGHRDRAAELMESRTGLERLRLVLERYPKFRDDDSNREEFYELELRYIKLVQEKDGGTFKQLMLAGTLLTGGLPQGAAPTWPGLSLYFTRLPAPSGPAAPASADLPPPTLIDPSLLSNLPVPEFVPGYSNLMDDKVERENYQRFVGSLVGLPATLGPAPLMTGAFYLAPFQVPALSDLMAPAFVPRALMQIEAPGPDGKPFVEEQIVMMVKARHGLIKPVPQASGPPGGMSGGMPSGRPRPAGMTPPSGTTPPN
jgi:hypothetical protein